MTAAPRRVAPVVLGLVATPFVAAVLALVPSGQAAASCAIDPGEPGALSELVQRTDGALFVGEVVEGGRVGERSRVAVREVWAGPDLPEVVWVRTGPAQPPWPLSLLGATSSSVDVELLLGATYLVGVPDLDAFATNACTATVLDDAIAAARPDDARAPVEGASPGHRPGPFETPLGATVVLGVALVAVLALWGRRLDRRAGRLPADAPPARRAAHGALRGVVVGVLVAGVAELATLTTLALFPTDVQVSGFSLVFGTPPAALVGTLCWWRDRPASHTVRLLLAALPVLLVGAVQVGIQWSAQ